MKYYHNKKIVVFEGISGSGKSTIIDRIMDVIPDSICYNWFSTDSFRYIASNIHLYLTDINPNIYSIIYALDYLSNMSTIRNDNEHCLNIMHRYIYTPLVHEEVRGVDKKLIDFLYLSPYFIEPDLVFFVDTCPQTAYNRIKKVRKPSYYECGLDIQFKNNIEKGREAYRLLTEKEERSLFLNFQTKIHKLYQETLPCNSVKINGEDNIKNQVKQVIKYINK